jgi:hypothetical protein
MRPWDQVLRSDVSKTGRQVGLAYEERDAFRGEFDHVAGHVEEGFSGF